MIQGFRAVGSNPLEVTDRDVDCLTWQFLQSDHLDDLRAVGPIDRRLDGFLRHRGLGCLADSGDIYNIILDRVVTYISMLPRHKRGQSST